jgi:hypothetical protein
MNRLRRSRFETVSGPAFLFQILVAVSQRLDTVLRGEIHESRQRLKGDHLKYFAIIWPAEAPFCRPFFICEVQEFQDVDEEKEVEEVKEPQLTDFRGRRPRAGKLG